MKGGREKQKNVKGQVKERKENNIEENGNSGK